MKDDSNGKIIGEFVGLKPNIYSMKNVDGKESNTAKGVNIATQFKEFKDTLFNIKVLRHKMRRIQGKKMRTTKNGNIRNQQNIIISFWWQKICFRWWNSYACLFS